MRIKNAREILKVQQRFLFAAPCSSAARTRFLHALRTNESGLFANPSNRQDAVRALTDTRSATSRDARYHASDRVLRTLRALPFARRETPRYLYATPL